MAALIESMDWSTTPLGPRESWPQSLRTVVSICLQSKFPILIWWGPKFVMLYNDAYRPMLGTKHPRSMGQPGYECWAEIWHIIGPMLQGVRERGEATWSEDQMLPLARYGFVEECYFTFSYSPIQDESGGIGGVFSAISETTERVIGERRLNTLHALSVAGKHESAAAACAEAARVLDANPNDLPFALIYLTEPGGETATLVGAAGTPPGERLALQGVRLQDRGPWPIADVLRTGNPATVPAAKLGIDNTVAVFPISAPGRDEPTGVLVAGISARRPFDDAYHSFLGLVAGHIAASVASARALEAERKRAEGLAEIDRAKTAFFSNVSHEFRTPLTLMLGPLEEVLAKPGELPLGQVHEQLQVTRRNSLRLLKLVNTLLDFSRLEAGRLRARYEPVDLAGFTAELAGVFHAAIERAGLHLRVACAPLSEPAYVDRDMWEKIVFNLLSNALKFTLQGEISVEVRRRQDQFELVVRDTGVGIPADELANLFKRFHRIENIRSRTHEGTGIGLALVQELAKLHGGAVEVESRVGHGSTFTVRIPAGCDHLPAEHVMATAPTARGISGDPADAASSRIKAESFSEEALRWLPTAPPFPTPAPGPFSKPPIASEAPVASAAGPRIILADDNADMRDYVRRLLGDAYQVDAFADGETAFAAIRARRPDLVLTDVMMPRLDGVGLLRAIRADAVLRDLPVIMLSARAGGEASAEGLDAGADDYVIKPFTARELRARIRSHLQMAGWRRSAGNATERERQRLYDILSRAPAIVCVLRGPEHVFELANHHYVELVGRRSANELLGKPIRTAIPEVHGQGFFELLDRVFATGEPYVGKEMPIKLQRSTGPLEEIVVNFVYQPTRDLDGRIDGILVHATDITELVRNRQRLEDLTRHLAAERDRSRASEQHLRAIVETTPECVKLVAGDGTLLEMNPAGLQMVEAGAAQALVGQNVYNVIAPEDRERFRRFNEGVCAGEKGALEFDVIGLQGTRRAMESHAVPLRLPDGQTVQLALTRDVTERNRTEHALRAVRSEAERERRLYHTVLASTPDLAYVFNLDHRFIYANEALLTMWGCTSADALGKTCLELGYEPWHAAMHDREIDAVVATKRPVRGEVPFTGAQGRRTYDYIFVPVLGADGEVEAVAGTTRDVTEMVQARETIARHRHELERLVDERTSKLKETIEQMEEFSYSVSHDLRSPVRAMQGYAEVLLEDYGDRLGDQGRDLLERVQRAGGRMDRLIQDLLTYSRISRREMKLEPVSLQRLIAEVVQQYPELQPGRAQIEVAPGVPAVLAHEPSLTQVVSNLLSNAVKFVATPRRPAVRVGFERHGDLVRVTFEDNGIGIPPEHRHRLFGMFERLHTEQAYEGTGIGLAIVRKAIERMNGKVGMESDGVNGSRFWFELPAPQGDAAGAVPTAASAVPQAPAGASVNGA